MATPPMSPPIIFHVDNTLGALLVGGLVATALWGVTCVQTFTFFMSDATDRAWHKVLVAFLLVLDTFDTFLNCHILYFYLVTNYFAPQAILFPVWSVIIHVAATSISNFIRVCTPRLSAQQRECTWDTVDCAFSMHSYSQLDSLSSLMYLNFAAGTSSDLSVALALCYLLRGSRTGFQRTDSLIRVLMMYTVNTGLIVALDATAGMFAYVFMPHNFIFLGFYLLLSKLYLNSYLAILNAREGLREKLDDPKSIHLSRLQSTMQWRHQVEYDLEQHRSDSQPALAISKSDGDTTLDISLGANGVGEKHKEYAESSGVAIVY
ncbi:hypothetical protein FB451DRAFT_274509 [Mycena latifolia]|nr:hypothetical protein FB451DRAFT_274509 [Mycena latifolia]